jgi:hypothetical protein
MERNYIMTLTVAQIESSYPNPVQGQSGYTRVLAYWVPMAQHADTLKAYRDAGIKIRIRFRGPRDPNRLMKAYDGRIYRRGEYSAQITCLKCEATHFTVYAR